jgi:hypothetical protein
MKDHCKSVWSSVAGTRGRESADQSGDHLRRTPGRGTAELNRQKAADLKRKTLAAAISLVLLVPLAQAGQAVTAKPTQVAASAVASCELAACGSALSATSHPVGGRIVSGTGSIGECHHDTAIDSGAVG